MNAAPTNPNLPGIPGNVEFKEANSGSPVVVLKHACGSSAEVSFPRIDSRLASLRALRPFPLTCL